MQEILISKGPGWTASTPSDTEIRPGTLVPLAPAQAGTAIGYPRPYASDRRNSRATAPVLAPAWAVRWRYAFPTTNPAFVYQQGNHVLINAGDWRLLDSDGNPVASGSASGALALLDSANNAFYTILASGFLSAMRLDNGLPIYKFLLQSGNDYAQTLLAKRGGRLLCGSSERQLDPHGGYQANRSLIEVTEVGNPVSITKLGLLTSGISIGAIQVPSIHSAFAADEKVVVAAIPNRIYVADWDMNVVRVLKSTFEPVSLSLDEAGRISLLIRKNDRLALWLLTQDGILGYALELPNGVPAPEAPPLIGFDHTVYLLSGRRILSVSQEGKLNWMKTTEGTVHGGLVTSSGELLVSEGQAITAWNARGERRVLFSFPGEELQTPPVIASNGEILAATRERLYCLVQAKSVNGR